MVIHNSTHVGLVYERGGYKTLSWAYVKLKLPPAVTENAANVGMEESELDEDIMLKAMVEEATEEEDIMYA